MRKTILVIILLIIVVFASGCTGSGSEQTETCVNMTVKEAREIAEDSECVKKGTLQKNYSCNENSKTLWIDLKADEKKELCDPACVVYAENRTAEVNWRCTGFIPE